MSESRLNAAFDTAVDGIVLMDARGVVTAFNQACERMFGYEESEVVGGDLDRLIAPAGYKGLANATGASLREIIGRRRNGETFPMDLSVGEGRQNGERFFVGVLRDATERKRAEGLRERLIERLTASNEERARFAQIASHELREPLRMMTAFCGLLSKDYSDRLDQRGREYLSLAVSATARMRDLLDDLVEFDQPESAPAACSWFEANDSFDQALDILHEVVRASGAKVTRDDLPGLRGRSIRFTRLLQNLIGNGLKYVGPGVTPRIHVSAARGGEFWRFAVSDNGIGVDARHQDQIFEPFKRLHPKGDYDGAGLGLAICRRIVEGFGGAIGVQSAPGEASTFSFTVKMPDQGGDHGRLDG